MLTRAVSALTSAILSSLPDYVAAAKITPEVNINPLLIIIIQRVEERMSNKSQADHQLIEQMADNTSILQPKNLDDYFKKLG